MIIINNNNNKPNAVLASPRGQSATRDGRVWSSPGISAPDKTAEVFSRAEKAPIAVSDELPGLLAPVNPNAKSHSSFREWEINFALLYSAYQRTDNKETKTTIRFLMTNYLQKAAFLNSSIKGGISEEDRAAYENMLQLGQMTNGGLYHRGAFTESSPANLLEFREKIGNSNVTSADIITLDTIEIQDLYPVGFAVAPDLSHPDQIVDFLVDQFEKNLGHFPERIQFPVLIDITQQIGQSLFTDGNDEKIRQFNEKSEEVKAVLDVLFKRAAAIIKAKHLHNSDIQTLAHDFLKINTVIVSRAQITDRFGILHLNFLSDDDAFENQDWPGGYASRWERSDNIRKKVELWAKNTSIGIGAINFRKAVAEEFPELTSLVGFGDGKVVDYVPQGRTDVMPYDRPDKILKSRLFETFFRISAENPDIVGPAQKLLAKATVKMMVTLLRKIPQQTWMDKQTDPTIRELTQSAMFRLSQHIATANNSLGDFKKFTQALDRAHAEMTLLLTLYMPFDAASFEQQFRAFIQPLLPDSIQPTTVGVAKSAMNVFAGANAAVMQNNPSPVRVLGAHTYYEEIELVGQTKTLDQALEDPTIEKVDLYIGEFHHNIDIDPKHTHYRKGTVAADIRKIFDKKPKTDALTVVIDATIDFIQSEDLKVLFKEFENEIKAGKLNIVCIRSGQKFDMVGFDNYYGSAFYIVNNGDKKWESFNKIKTDKVYQTDELSLQFFSWMAETGFQITDEYKGLIFENARKILQLVPEGLKPQAGRAISISGFDNDVLAPFFEVTFHTKSNGEEKLDPTSPDYKKRKLKLEYDQEDLRAKLQELLLKTFIDHEKLIFMRGSFGFHHPNLTWIDPKFRINPGLDPSDIPLYVEFFQKAEAILSHFEKTGEVL